MASLLMTGIFTNWKWKNYQVPIITEIIDIEIPLGRIFRPQGVIVPGTMGITIILKRRLPQFEKGPVSPLQERRCKYIFHTGT